MRIAFISYEYPPDTAVGGIATYVYQISLLMHKRGHEVEVFCGSQTRQGSSVLNGIHVHHIITDRFKFPSDVLSSFNQRQAEVPFDIIESPEFTGDGYYIKKFHPHIPLVVKLHTPWFHILHLNYFYLPLINKVRFILSGLLKGQINRPFWRALPKEQDIDYKITLLADQIHTPSISLGNIVSRQWEIRRDKILLVPNPYVPSSELLKIPLATKTGVITYMGRLETRKGIIKLVQAIPLVADRYPHTRFRFVGKSLKSPNGRESMIDFITKKLERYAERLEFLEVTSSEIPRVLAEAEVVVLPSIWENFPNTCLEAMSAGRAIVASKEGGMVDMLAEPQAGLLVSPLNHREISSAILQLLGDDNLKETLGNQARKSVLEKYSENRIGNLVEGLYTDLLK